MGGEVVHELLLNTPIIALLVIFIILDRRDHRRTVEAMRQEIQNLQQALIDHMNRLAE